MSTIPYGFEVRSSGALQSGLSPTWSSLRKLSDGTSISSPGTVAVISELGGGLYKIAYDPEGGDGELIGVIDAGSGITADADRYITIVLAQDSSRVARLDATIASRASQASLDTVDDFLDTEIVAIKAKTDNLPASPAAVGSPMTLAADAVNANSLATSAIAELVAALPAPGQVYRLLATPLMSGRTEPVRLTRGSTGLTLRDWLTDGNGQRLDLTGATVTASLLRKGASTYVFENRAADLGNAPEEGQVELTWPNDSLDTPGAYTLFWTVTGAPGVTGALRWHTEIVIE